MKIFGGMERSGDCQAGWWSRIVVCISLPNKGEWYWYDNGYKSPYPSQMRLRIGPFFLASQSLKATYLKTDKHFPVAGVAVDRKHARFV